MLINTSGIQSNQILFSGATNNTSSINALSDNIERTFNLSPSYFLVTKTLNGIEYPNTFYDTWIMDQESYKEVSSNKKIIMKPNQDLDRGDLINWNNQEWLCTNVDMQVFPYNEGVLEFCNNTLKCILPNGKLLETGCVISAVSKKSMTIEKEGTFMESQKMPFLVICQNNDFTKTIPLSYRLLFGRFAYRITDFDDISARGTVIMLMTSDQNRPTDNFSTMVADNNSLQIPVVTGSLIIDGSAKITTGTSQNYQVLYDNGNTATGMTFIFTVSSTNAIITVVDGLNVSILGKTSSQFKLTGTCGTTVLTKIISIANSF